MAPDLPCLSSSHVWMYYPSLSLPLDLCHLHVHLWLLVLNRLSSQSELASGHHISQSVPLVSPLTLFFISVCSSVSFLHNPNHPYFHLCPSHFLAHTFAMWWTTQHYLSWWMVSFLMSIIELPTCLAFLPAQTHTGNLWLVSMSLTCTDAMYLPPPSP